MICQRIDPLSRKFKKMIKLLATSKLEGLLLKEEVFLSTLEE